ncbi:MAG TPA: TetR family transcriptional regulator [Solirubrobacterales bacterium]|nr:TetR family transcriptional regulator [Solirubrobacterales bacterium]
MTSSAEVQSDGGGQRPDSLYRKLKPRPGHSGQRVAEHQRSRIHAATIELVNERGYDGLTVIGIARAAGISNRTFYENFKGKEDCFLATYELIVRHTAREVLAARHRERGWRAKLRAGFLAFAREVADNPKAARLALVEAFTTGASSARMGHTNGLFETLVADSLARDDSPVDLPPLIVKGIVAGATRIARVRLLAGEEQHLSGDADELLDWALSLHSPAAGEVCTGSVEILRTAAARPAQVERGAAPFADRELAGDERTMILSAVVQLAATEEYGALTVPRIRAAAGISRRRFEAHFKGVSDCFLAALELLAARALARAKAAYLSADDWPRGIHRACVSFCREVADDPVLVRLAFFEIVAPGHEGIEWRVNLIGEFSSLLRCTAPPGQRPSKLIAGASAGAAWAVLHHYAMTGRAQQAPGITGTVAYLLLAPAIGAEAAAEVIRSEEREAAGRAFAADLSR